MPEEKTAVSQRERKTRWDKGISKPPNARDIACLRWIGEQRLVSTEQVGVLLGRFARTPRKPIGYRGTMKVIQRWREQKWVELGSLNELSFVWLRPKGMQYTGLDFDTREPSLLTVNHSCQINEVRLYLESQYGNEMRFESERMVRATEPDFIIPDAVVERNQRVAIEVELTVKQLSRYPQIFRSHSNHFDWVWYFVNDKTKTVVKNQAAKFEEYLGADFVRITHLDEVHYEFASNKESSS